jgi:hypothetical protein
MFNDAFHLLGLIAVGLLIAWTVVRLSRRYNRLRVDRLIDTRHRDFDSLLSRNNPYYRASPLKAAPVSFAGYFCS